jgi:hypothetical protein
MPNSSRSYDPITHKDLQRLRDIEATDRREFFVRNPRYTSLSGRVVCVALCQGAALHYVDNVNGVKDFDVWTFYAALPDVKYPRRPVANYDFGDPKFGQSSDKPEYIGRRVDLLGRSLNVQPTDDPVVVLRQYLSEGRTSSAKHLAMKAVVLLEPAEYLGTVVWQRDVKKQSGSLRVE